MAKTSKRTEEEMLQETFAQFQTQATTEEAATESGDSPRGSVKSSSGKNNAILLGSCVAAAGIIGYIFFVKPMLSESPQQAQTQLNQSTPVASIVPEITKEPVNMPLPSATVAEDPLVAAKTNSSVPAIDPIAQLQALQAQEQASLMPAPIPVQDPVAQIKAPEVDSFFAQNQGQLPVPVPVTLQNTTLVQDPIQLTVPINSVSTIAQVDPVAPIQPSVQVVADVANVQSSVPLTGLDAQQTNVISELQNRFESSNNEFKNLLSGVDSRVTNIEGKLSAHDERITRLESFHGGQKSKNKVVEKSEVSADSDIKAVATTEKAKAIVRRVRPAVKHKETSSQDENILFGSSNKRTKQKETSVKVEKQDYQDYPIHSIYGGRFWIKNNDGSLSTYAAGDKLPSGEIVKEVNDEKFSIKTNLRTIVKR